MENRYFVIFKQYTSLHNKVMVFHKLTNQEVWDYINRRYPYGVDKVIHEHEFARLLPDMYHQHEVWVEPETELVVYKTDNTSGMRTNEVLGTYPVSNHVKQEHSVTLEPITQWFKTALTKVNNSDKTTQLGCFFEEVAEAISVLKQRTEDTDLQNTLSEALISVSKLSKSLYLSKGITLDENQNTELLDALCDVVVTCTGSAYVLGYNWDSALTEVNQSNFSKFENGKVLRNEHGKIIKGKDYFKPNLEPFIKKS